MCLFTRLKEPGAAQLVRCVNLKTALHQRLHLTPGNGQAKYIVKLQVDMIIMKIKYRIKR